MDKLNVRIVKSQEEMGKIHSYHDTWLPALNIFIYEILPWPLTWPRYRSKVRKRLNPYSSWVFWEILPDWYQRIHYTKAALKTTLGINDLTYFR